MMNEKILNVLYYVAWIVGFFAVGILVYGIIKSLIG